MIWKIECFANGLHLKYEEEKCLQFDNKTQKLDVISPRQVNKWPINLKEDSQYH